MTKKEEHKESTKELKKPTEEIEEEEEPATPTPKVKQPSSGSMVIPVMRG